MADFDFTVFPNRETPRLLLRAWQPADVTDLFAIHGDPEVQKYDSDPPMESLAQATAAIERSAQHFQSGESIGWAIVLKAERRAVGAIGFYFEARRYYKVDLGYSLARAYWRQGIMTEALRELLGFAFENLRVHRVNVDTRTDNTASVRLMAALGFQPEGARRECILNPDGSYQTWGLFGLLDREYWALKAS